MNGTRFVILSMMKIATYNVNGISARLPVLLKWLETSAPDVVCLQELKAPQEKFPEQAIVDAGYRAIWQGQKSWNGVAILSKGHELEEIQRGLPGDPDDEQSRYLEARVNGIHVCGLYLPNGNPAPGPKFDYKLAWMERLKLRAKELVKSKEPVVMTGDFNVIPTDVDAYKPERWVNDALFFSGVESFFCPTPQAGLDRRDPPSPPRCAHLYLLGLFPQCLRPQRRHPHRSFSPQPAPGEKAQSRRRRHGCPRLGKDQRPRAGVDRNS